MMTGACQVFIKLSLLGVLLLGIVQGRTLDRCSLAREMLKMGVHKDQLARWTCVAEHESSYRTNVVGPSNTDGSNDYGIFQINDRFWCQPASGKHSHNLCHISCSKLLTDDITNSVHCAQKVLRAQGWSAWSVYKPHCSGHLKSIDDCFRHDDVLEEVDLSDLSEYDDY